MDDLLPTTGEWIRFLGSRFNMSVGTVYQIVRVDYTINTAFQVCVLNDDGTEKWIELVEFSLMEDYD